jgi:diguanylate cyclase (GGDEF)-like protein
VIRDVASFVAGAAAVAVPAGLLVWRTRRAACRDDLTGLLNRKAFKVRAARLLTGRCGAAAVAIVDLNRLKTINDTPGLGHEVGDAVLVAAAARLREVVGDHGVVGRLGGDEFAVAVAAPAGEHLWRVDALFGRVAQRIREPIAARAGLRLQVSASIGVAPVVDGVSLSALLRRADHAMYQAKRTGKSLVVDVDLDGDEDAGRLAVVRPQRLRPRNEHGIRYGTGGCVR